MNPSYGYPTAAMPLVTAAEVVDWQELLLLGSILFPYQAGGG